LIHLTSDGGKNWRNVTPPSISAWQKISLIDAGHFDAGTAYAAVNTLRLDDMRPHLYRTHDAGKTWTEIVKGIPDGQTTNVVREDTQRKGLLFAGTERGVYISFDDGDTWDSLRLNMPATSVRDLIIKDDDIAVATHGRGFWILDNISPLRHLTTAGQGSALFKPQAAFRVRWNLNPDTPLPPDEPAGENPPDGAIIDYFLAEDSADPVTLEIKDKENHLVRRYSSSDIPVQPDPIKLKIPRYWIRPFRGLSAQHGMHRFLWDLHYTPLPGVEPEYPIAAVYRDTSPNPTSSWVTPGNYTVTLTAAGKTYTQPLTVRMDPRVKMSPAELQEQLRLSQQLCEMRSVLEPIGHKFDSLAEQITKLKEQTLPKSAEEKLNALTGKLKEFGPADPRFEDQLSFQTLESVKNLFGEIQGVDAPLTGQVKAAVNEVRVRVAPAVDLWKKIIANELPNLNKELVASGLPRLDPETERRPPANP
jgi:hypothetical protein